MNLLQALGIDDVSGPFYAFYSGIGGIIIPPIMTVGGFAVVQWWHHRCHYPCWRIGRHPHQHFNYCKHHHPNTLSVSTKYATMQIMKKILISIAVAVVVITGAVAVAVHYKQNQQKQAVAQQSEVAKAKAQDQSKLNDTSAKLVAEQAQCKEGNAAYILLTPAQKAKLQAPAC
jgi:uncharacterized protein YxeA